MAAQLAVLARAVPGRAALRELATIVALFGKNRSDSYLAPGSRMMSWPGGFLFLTPAMRNRPHRHFSAALLIALERPFEFQLSGDPVVHHRRVALLAPEMEKRLDSHEGALAVLHLDPDTAPFRRIAGLCASAPVVFPDERTFEPLIPRLRSLLTAADTPCAGAQALFADCVAALGQHEKPLDPRIARLSQALRKTVPKAFDFGDFAKSEDLSPSRLRHLFKDELGITMRSYVQWLKMWHALRLLVRGHSLTRVAFEVGFYDLAHLIHSARQAYDVLPSLLANRDYVKVSLCPAPLATA